MLMEGADAGSWTTLPLGLLLLMDLTFEWKMEFDVSRKCAVAYTAHCVISSDFLRLCCCAFVFHNKILDAV